MTSQELASEAANAQVYPQSSSSDSASADASGSGPVETVAPAEDFLKTEFLHRLAHDLRGHAGVIHGALQELEASFGEQAASSTFFGMAKRGVRRILRTADRLQQTGQLERGAPTLSSAECDVRALVQQAAEDAHNIEGRKKISVELDMPAVMVALNADSHWLTSAFFELASNSIRHAQSRVRVTVTSDADAVRVEFCDDGRPTGEFGPTRFHAPRERRGLGLGLSIVHDVAQAHAGTLQIGYGRADGSEPFGAKVTLSLPKR
jgi:two-component system sensor histidine kinase/response regulator